MKNQGWPLFLQGPVLAVFFDVDIETGSSSHGQDKERHLAIMPPPKLGQLPKAGSVSEFKKMQEERAEKQRLYREKMRAMEEALFRASVMTFVIAVRQS